MINTDANEYNIYFTGQTQMNNEPADIGIGYAQDTDLAAKIDVISITQSTDEDDYTNQYAGRFYNTGSYSSGDATDLVGVVG